MSVQLQNPPPAVGSQPATACSTDNGFNRIPLSAAQQRLWLLDQLHPGSPVYNVPVALHLKGSLNLPALHRSLQSIIERHESLRTVFTVVNDVPVQEITSQKLKELPLIDLSAGSEEEKKQNLQRRLVEEARRPFDLKNDLMLRALVFRTGVEAHVLFLNIHHIACDEWSMGVLFRELGILYEAFCGGRNPTLEELPIQYADFAVWQCDCLQGEALKKPLQYWKDKLRGTLPVLELPADRQRPAERTHDGATIRYTFPANLSLGLKTLCRDEGVTLFMVLLAAFKTLLHRYTGQEDIIIGTPVAGRNRLELESLIGFFVNTLPLRTSISASMTFRELLRRVREDSLTALTNQELPFDKLVEELHPDRSTAQNPIFNVLFAVQNSTDSVLIPGLQVSAVEIDNDTAKVDLTLVFQETPQGLAAALEYSADLFSEATAVRILQNMQTLLESVIANATHPISKLPLLSRNERRKVIEIWNQTGSEFPRADTVHQLFSAQAHRTPGALAVVYGDKSLTFLQLEERTNQLAHFLIKAGVSPNALVGICMHRSIDMIVGWLGILKAGATYVPLDPTYPEERLEFMLEDTQMPLLLTEKALSSRLPKGARKICLDSEWKTISHESPGAPEGIATTSENLAYVIYTSGSTGKPKGVCVPHRGIVRLLFNTNYVQLEAADRIAQVSNSSFDAATFEVWGALLHGGQLVGLHQDVLLSPRDFASQLRENRITTLFLTTALFNQVAADVPDAFRPLKQVFFGGEACDPRAVKDILHHGAPQRLVHVYGPTETTTFASWFEVQNVPPGATTLPIGRPISNTTFYVLDQNLQLVPVGAPGELFIGGAGVACGYHNRPELTQAKFIRNPFSDNPKDVLYRTGDLVRFLPEGDVEFLGRVDNQVKIRGFRIELEEIESALQRHPAVREAVVLARDDQNSKRLVAYIVSQREQEFSVDDLRQFLKTKLPEFMIPSAFVHLDNLPITANGKIDRRALPAPDNANLPTRQNIAPRNNLENQLRKIWESVLGVQPIGIRDNFFELGGHSLLAVRLFTQIEQKLGLKLPLSTLFQAPTIEQLAPIISTKTWSAPGASLVEIQPNGTKLPIFWLHTLGGGGGGGLFAYRKVAEYLGSDQPSYGLVTPPNPFTRIEDMAAHYINEMRTIQPSGPYHLGGYCFGGVIAFEMARQLADKGFKVGMLALIESMPPNCDVQTPLSPVFISHFVKNLPTWVAHLARQKPSDLVTKVQFKLAALRRKIQRAGKPPVQNPTEITQSQLSEIIDFANYPADFKRYAEIHWQALGNYRPQIFSGRITLFRTHKPYLFNFDPETVWSRVAANGVDVRFVPGTHESILEDPSARVLAQEMLQVLNSKQEPTRRQVA